MKTKTSPEPEPPTENVSATVENNVNNIITLTIWQERQESFKQEVHYRKSLLELLLSAHHLLLVVFISGIHYQKQCPQTNVICCH